VVLDLDSWKWPTLFSFFFRYKHLHGFVEMDIFFLGVLAFG